MHNIFDDICPAENRKSAAEAVYTHVNYNWLSLCRHFPGCLSGVGDAEAGDALPGCTN